jgi:hypothetical protein
MHWKYDFNCVQMKKNICCAWIAMKLLLLEAMNWHCTEIVMMKVVLKKMVSQQPQLIANETQRQNGVAIKLA